MKYLFVPPKQSFQLKELGFDEPCFGWYSSMDGNPFRLNYCETYLGIENCTKAPTFAQAFTFFREKYGLYIQPNRIVDSEGIWYYFTISTKRTDVCEGSFIYEEAELACLIKLIDIVKARNIGEQFTSTPKN